MKQATAKRTQKPGSRQQQRTKPKKRLAYPLMRQHNLQGNHAVLRKLPSSPVNKTRQIIAQNARTEIEADHIANHVLGARSLSNHTRIHRHSAFNAKNSQTKVGAATQQRLQALRGRGKSLPKNVINLFQPRLNQDLSQVRIHTNEQAAQTAKELKAKAFTTGRDIVFAKGQFSPNTSRGRSLIAHELAHTVQQRNDSKAPIMRAPQESSEELRLFPQVPKPIVTHTDSAIYATVFFSKDSFLMNPVGFKAVQKLSEDFKYMHNPTVVVDGYASTEGSDKYNLTLSRKRRAAVIAALGAKLGGKLTIIGKPYGESKSAETETAKVPNELEKQRSHNRKVDIMAIPAMPAEAKAVEPKKAEKKKIDLLPKPEVKPETLEERVERIIKEPAPKPPEKKSPAELIEKKIDTTLDDVLRTVRIPNKYRKPIKDAAKKGIKKGAEAVIDDALEKAGASKEQKEAIKKAVERAAETKFIK